MPVVTVAVTETAGKRGKFSKDHRLVPNGGLCLYGSGRSCTDLPEGMTVFSNSTAETTSSFYSVFR